MLVGLLGGRAAEELVFETVTTGAANDIEKATKIARAMITQYGMSKKFGLMGLATVEDQYLNGRVVLNCGDDTATEIDHEVMLLLEKSYEESKRLIGAHRESLDRIAEYLIRKETITGKEFMKIFHAVEQGIPIPDNLDDLKLPEKPQEAEKDGQAETADHAEAAVTQEPEKTAQVETADHVEAAVTQDPEKAGQVETADHVEAAETQEPEKAEQAETADHAEPAVKAEAESDSQIETAEMETEQQTLAGVTEPETDTAGTDTTEPEADAAAPAVTEPEASQPIPEDVGQADEATETAICTEELRNTAEAAETAAQSVDQPLAEEDTDPLTDGEEQALDSLLQAFAHEDDE